MKHGIPQPEDAETFRSIYKKLNIYGMTIEPLTAHEMVMIFSYGRFIDKYFEMKENRGFEK